jgi:hypothetical protein
LPVVIPLAAGGEDTQAVPLLVNTLPEDPTAVKLVPPLATGRAVPDKVTAKVPLLVIDAGVTDKKLGTDIPTLVTVPALGVVQAGTLPLVVKTFPELLVWSGSKAGTGAVQNTRLDTDVNTTKALALLDSRTASRVSVPVPIVP